MTFNKEDTCNENSGLEEFIKYDTQKKHSKIKAFRGRFWQ